MNYRPDIDGLRAIAVIAVILFHLNISSFSGGFVGVDVFFVISGYLITSIILKELQAGSFSFTSFYMRRVRRIIPMLYAVAGFSAVGAALILLPQDLEKFGQSLIATVLFGSNIFFLSETGYFTAPVVTKPLLHTWSLAVEEQFYIIFPVLLFLACKYGKSKYALLIILLAAGSFLISVVETHRHMEQAFYLAHTRAWEFLLGSLLAVGFLPHLKSRKFYEVLGFCGLISLLAPILLYKEGISFPGINAVLPCMGAFLLIYAGSAPHDTFAKKLLSSAPFTYTGLRSYSLYLWHWPLIVFLSYLSPAALTNVEKTLIIGATFALSEFSYRHIETPCRKGVFFRNNAYVLRTVGLASLTLLVLGGTLILLKGEVGRYENVALIAEQKNDHVENACIDIKAEDFLTKKCKFGDVSKANDSFIVWGDSHAYAITPGISKAAAEAGKRGTLSSNSGCPPITTTTNLSDTCQSINKLVLSEVKPGTTVFLATRWTYYHDKSPINREGPVLLRDQASESTSPDESYQVLERGLETTIKNIQDKGGIPVLVSAGPEFYRDVPEAAYIAEADVKIERKTVAQRNADADRMMDQLAQKFGIDYINTLNTLCDQDFCYGSKNGEVLFFDNDHMNTKGAALLSPEFERMFRKSR